MSWLNHPRYVPTRERLIGYLRSDRYRFRRLTPVVFLCGGAGSPRRDTLRDYLRRHSPKLGLFYAERVWEQISSREDLSALAIEAELAELADVVIVIVESPGTFAELGAFSLSEPLRKKLLPIVDKQYAHKESSFLATGPLRWIDRESMYGPTIYVPLRRILEAVDQIEDRFKRIPEPHSTKIDDLATSPKHLLFFLCDLVAVIHPATDKMIEYYLGRIAPSIPSSNISIQTLIGLGVAMDLLKADEVRIANEPATYYSPAAVSAIERPFHHGRFLHLPSQRAAHASVLLTLPQAKRVLESLRKAS